jgi:type IV pilus assembly protein PilQ
MKTWSVLLVSSMALFLVSCTHITPPVPAATAAANPDAKTLESLKASEQREVLKAASQRLDETREALKRGKVAEAETSLQPLLNQDLFPNEVNDLRDQIQQAKDKANLDKGKKETERRALQEVERSYVLPSTYGSTVVIDGQPGSVAIPPGPMEELFQRRVDINVESAGVKELVEALKKIEGLNIIADDALEAKKALTIRVEKTPLSEVLSYVARNMGIAFNLGENVVWVTASTEPQGSGPKLETQIYRLRQGFIPSLQTTGGGGQGEGGGEGGGGGGGGADTELEDAIQTVTADGPEGSSYRVFRNRNILLVRNSRENLRLIEKLIEEFDKPPNQVLIEARFLTISQDDLRDVGVEVAQRLPEHQGGEPVDINGDGTISDSEKSAADTYGQILKAAGKPAGEVSDFLTELGTLKPGNTDGLGSLTISGIIGNRTYDMVISALDKRGSARTLSAPRVTVLNNQTARIRKGDKTLYYDELETVAASGGGEGGSAATQTAFTGTPKELELGVTLEVKVNIGNDGKTVMLGLQPEVIDLLRWRAFTVVAGDSNNSSNNDNNNNTSNVGKGQIELPETTESVVNTTVAVKSGETVVLGGMVKSITQHDVKKIPILGDIPYLGILFRHTTDKDQPQHLLIFVTATVVNDSGQFTKVQEPAK